MRSRRRRRSAASAGERPGHRHGTRHGDAVRDGRPAGVGAPTGERRDEEHRGVSARLRGVPAVRWHLRWMDHLLENGSIVLFPRYQPGVDDPFVLTPFDLAKGLQTGFDAIGYDGEPVVAAGFSLGAALAVIYAAHAEEWDVPSPRSVYSIFPVDPVLVDIELDLSTVEETNVLLLVGENDEVVGQDGAREILKGLVGLPPSLKQLRVIRTTDDLLRRPRGADGRSTTPRSARDVLDAPRPARRGLAATLTCPGDASGAVTVRASRAASSTSCARSNSVHSMRTPCPSARRHESRNAPRPLPSIPVLPSSLSSPTASATSSTPKQMWCSPRRARGARRRAASRPRAARRAGEGVARVEVREPDMRRRDLLARVDGEPEAVPRRSAARRPCSRTSTATWSRRRSGVTRRRCLRPEPVLRSATRPRPPPGARAIAHARRRRIARRDGVEDRLVLAERHRRRAGAEVLAPDIDQRLGRSSPSAAGRARCASRARSRGGTRGRRARRLRRRPSRVDIRSWISRSRATSSWVARSAARPGEVHLEQRPDFVHLLEVDVASTEEETTSTRSRRRRRRRRRAARCRSAPRSRPSRRVRALPRARPSARRRTARRARARRGGGRRR